jgi:transcriptional regulator with XRE-family HTH domain
MESESWFKEKLEAFKDDLDFRLETLIYNITETISVRLKEKKLSRTKFANLMNISPPAVTKLLNGNSNFTLKKLLEIADALDLKLKVAFESKEVVDNYSDEKPIRESKVSFYQDKAYSDKSKKLPLSNALDTVPGYIFDKDQDNMAA